MPMRLFDAIVVGTGAGGGMAMKLLCEAGLSVLALNSGPRTDPAKHYRMHRQPYDLKYRGEGNPLSLAGRAHQEHYSVEEGEYTEGPELFEHDVAYSNAPGTDWYWKRCKGTGGKANFWGRSSARYGDIDFKAASLDGFGEDWPVDYAEIAPWFSRAERYMGVASTVQNRPSNPDGDYLPQIPWRCLDYIIQEAGKKIGVPYLPDRCAQLTVAHNGHPACHYCGNCTRGCGFIPRLVGQPPTPDNIADSTIGWMPRWQNLENPREEKFIRGYSVYVGGGCGEFPGHYPQLEGFGSEFKRNIKRYYPATIGSYIQAPALASPKNYVDIDPDKKDIFGIPRLRFHYEWGENELLMWEHSKKMIIDFFRAAGGEMWGADAEPNRPGTSLHEVGVCRMGNNPKTSFRIIAH